MIHLKTEKEIELIRESCKIVHDTLEFVGSKIKAGEKLTLSIVVLICYTVVCILL